MPGRTTPLVTGELYHLINRGVASQPVFKNKRDHQRFLETMTYYQNRNTPVRYSKFLILSVEDRQQILRDLKKQRGFLVEFVSFCLLPNHLHFVVKQLVDNGISKFMANLTNSYTRYFNVKHKRRGHLFQGRFKAIRVETDEQLFHLVRYIHLNPYTSYLVKKIEEVALYPYSSLGEYLGLSQRGIVEKKQVLAHFATLESFKEFTFSQADYQRKLKEIEHLLLER